MELVKSLVSQLGVTSEQAEGGAGAIFRLAQQRMADDQFVQVAYATPAVSDLMAKAPPFVAGSRGGLVGWVGKFFGGLGSLRPLAPAFRQIGLSDQDVRPFVKAVCEYVDQQERPDASALLRRALQ